MSLNFSEFTPDFTTHVGLTVYWNQAAFLSKVRWTYLNVVANTWFNVNINSVKDASKTTLDLVRQKFSVCDSPS